MTTQAVEEVRNPGISLVWLEKYAVFSQSGKGVPQPLDHMLLAEVIPYSPEDDYRVQGFRDGERVPFVEHGSGDSLFYVNEWFVDRKACSYDSASELDRAFPNTPYRFRVQDAKGSHELALLLGGEDGITRYPSAPAISIRQADREVTEIDSTLDAQITWTAFPTQADGQPSTRLFGENTIFVLVDNCRGETVFSSGSGQRTETLKSSTTAITIPAMTLEPGLRYTAFVSFINTRSTDAARSERGTIAGVAVNSVAVEFSYSTLGHARDSRNCPPLEMRANYRWPGKLRSSSGLRPWPVDSSGLRLELDHSLRAGKRGR